MGNDLLFDRPEPEPGFGELVEASLAETARGIDLWLDPALSCSSCCWLPQEVATVRRIVFGWQKMSSDLVRRSSESQH